jgi:hypothetical protein
MSYTREQINAMVGGGVQSFLPTKNGRVTCGCFVLKQNPDAPAEVLVGIGPQRERTAQVAVLQQTPFPVFVKREVGDWEFVGIWRGARYLHCGHKFLAEDERAKAEDVAGILFLEKVEVPEKVTV